MTLPRCARGSLALLTALVVLSACAKQERPPGPGFVSFESFVSATRSAVASDYVGKAGVRVQSDKDFGEMKAHLLRLYDGMPVVNSFWDQNQFVDCTPIDQQPSIRLSGVPGQRAERSGPKPGLGPGEDRTKPAPELPRLGRRGIDLTLKPGRLDGYGQEMYCRDGTVPIRRLTLEEMTRFKTLSDFFAKGSQRDDFEIRPRGRGELKPEDEAHYYARGVQYVDNFGGDSWLNVWNPTVATDQMSLSQQWFVGGDGDTKQTIEGGWQVAKQWGTTAALFIYYTTKGYSKDSGCYNQTCTGFVLVANNVYLGKGFTSYSSSGGTQWGFNLQWKRHTDGNWWLFYRGPGNYIAVGYYPKSLWGTGQLATKATKIAYGGEDTGEPSALQMGSGSKADQGWQRAAFQNVIFYIDTQTVSQWANLEKYESHPECYTASINNIYGSWGTYLYFGGPSCK
jgi:neprosin-like protein